MWIRYCFEYNVVVSCLSVCYRVELKPPKRNTTRGQPSSFHSQQQVISRIEQRKIDNLFAEMEPQHISAPTLDVSQPAEEQWVSQRLAVDDTYGKTELMDWDDTDGDGAWEDAAEDLDLKEVQETLRHQKQLERQQRRLAREERMRQQKAYKSANKTKPA
eukprot:m.107128 g.107128  ORF g.107128 m.107128 type:complete len:160 (+) comp15174_c0_seq2:138-617(+)